MRSKLRDGMSLWLPLVCALMFVITMTVCLLADLEINHIESHQTVVSDAVLAFSAFSSSPGQETNPWNVYVDVGGMLSELKNACTVALAIISDLIIVCGNFLS